MVAQVREDGGVANERVTENLIRDKLRKLGYYDAANEIRVDEQKSAIEGIRRALLAASKTGGSGIGSPEFIITNPDQPGHDFAIIIECKADIKNHASPTASIMIPPPPNESPQDRTRR